MAKAAGALFIIDDCLMFRLAVGRLVGEVRPRPRHRLPRQVDRGRLSGRRDRRLRRDDGGLRSPARVTRRLSRRLVQRQPDRLRGRQDRGRGPDRRADRDHGPARRRARGRDRGGWEEARHRRRRARRRLGVRRLRARPRRRVGKHRALGRSLHLAAINRGVYFGPGRRACDGDLDDRRSRRARRSPVLDAALADLEPLITSPEEG